MLTAVLPGEAGELHRLYQSLVGQPGCVWDADYPTRDNAEEDIAAGRVWAVRDGEGRIIAAVSVEEDDVRPVFCPEDGRPAVCLCRVAVMREHQGQGLAQAMVRELLDVLRARGYAVLRLLVHPDNPPAMRTYQRLGFVPLGLCHMYGHRYLACALELA